VKVVLFCGGMGMRLRDYSTSCPSRWCRSGAPHRVHLMSFTHATVTRLHPCLGYRGTAIKDYFLKYDGPCRTIS